mmetsp:Transcript_35526/g.74584  ORF Transcript_35526/g.74584 Transcript_35526/m.74584 type:complete len:235 (+) Transcript_35526:186-890(+)
MGSASSCEMARVPLHVFVRGGRDNGVVFKDESSDGKAHVAVAAIDRGSPIAGLLVIGDYICEIDETTIRSAAHATALLAGEPEAEFLSVVSQGDGASHDIEAGFDASLRILRARCHEVELQVPAQTGTRSSAVFGLHIGTRSDAQRTPWNGWPVAVLDVAAGGLAAATGKIPIGSVIHACDGEEVMHAHAVASVLGELRPGGSVTLFCVIERTLERVPCRDKTSWPPMMTTYIL